MRGLLFLLLFTTLSFGQEFKYSGYVYNSSGSGIPNIPVKLLVKRTALYEISYPTYSPNSFTTGTVVGSSDDVVSGVLNIGFTFNYFGNNYSQFYIGSNGWIGFSSGQTTGYTAQFIPSTGSPVNAILADWEDLYPGASNIYYTTTGTAPNRKLIVSFNAVPHYSCRTTLYTFQFVLYETTNIIDIIVANKPLCAGNNATEGLVGPVYTTVIPVGARNAVQWTVTNQTIRFTPKPVDVDFIYYNIYNTDSTGKYTINSGLDINPYQFKIMIEALTFTKPTSSDYLSSINLALNPITSTSKKFYMFDVNDNSKFTVADAYKISGFMSGRFLNLTPNYRLFIPSEWSVINVGTTNLKTTYPGLQTITITSPVNNSSSNYYLIKTGYNN